MGGGFVRKSNGVAASAVILGGNGEISRWWLRNQRRAGCRGPAKGQTMVGGLQLRAWWFDCRSKRGSKLNIR
ncbi:hypothetical protein ACFX2I_043633 [Malus domestica]